MKNYIRRKVVFISKRLTFKSTVLEKHKKQLILRFKRLNLLFPNYWPIKTVLSDFLCFHQTTHWYIQHKDGQKPQNKFPEESVFSSRGISEHGRQNSIAGAAKLPVSCSGALQQGAFMEVCLVALNWVFELRDSFKRHANNLPPKL